MDTNPVLDVTTTSPSRSSPARNANKQGSDGASVFGQVLTKEIDRNRPQSSKAPSATNYGEKTVSPNKDYAWGSFEKTPALADSSSTNTYASEDTQEMDNDVTETTQPAPEANIQDGTAMSAAAAAQAVPIVVVDEVESASAESSGKPMEIILDMVVEGDVVEQPPPETAQGPGVAVEQPPPQIPSSEPARLAEAQPETKSTDEQIAPQTITVTEFQRLLSLNQARAAKAQAEAVAAPDVTSSEAQTPTQAQNGAGVPAEQSASALDNPATQAQNVLRSLQQYSDIEEIAYTQAADSGVNPDASAGQKQTIQADLPDQVDLADQTAQSGQPDESAQIDPAALSRSVVTKNTTNTPVEIKPKQTQAEPVPATEPQPEPDAAEIEQLTNNRSLTEPPVVSGDDAEKGSSLDASTQGKPKFNLQSAAGQDPQNQGSAADKVNAQAKANPTIIEMAPESGNKSTPPATVQAQSGSRSTSEVSQTSSEPANASEQNYAAAMLNTKSGEITFKNSESHTVQHVVQQTLNQVEGMLQTGQKSLRVQLYPENLGHLELRLTSNNGSLQITILADSSVTQEALQQNARDLQQSLQQSGVNLSSLTVGQRGDQEQTSSQSHRAYKQQSKTNGRVLEGEDIEQIETNPTGRLTYLNPYSSMEYRV